ncbi:hypothetical protein [Pedobacter heparinus]|jgi:hypothetical protein|uniref:Uncharacterized protein n=1 Tax=Pedobacter heparinus (strain ATCC 13125 / DSM 2366 / CIP 104194 / JCM 7457 / NBRC 12017 / NCIMB 9290 / NRRL B-14731 / HIM 762-3) TaxID=485917 RepID=C6XVF6_PEDHD|nr:hypothetical protein [Pedobacter heparinus]ACU04022.1 hypothetical protein Phep_1813 [Pedobacter heparinus DSM 2366]
MTTATIRQKLHNYLEVADDKKVRAIYTMMETEVESEMTTYTDELKSVLDQRFADVRNGDVELVSEEESKQRIYDILASRNK